MGTGEIRNGRLPPVGGSSTAPSTDATDLIQAGKAIHDSLWKKTEGRIDQAVSEVKSLVDDLGEKVGFTIDQELEGRVREAVEVAVKESLSEMLQEHKKKSLVFQSKTKALERKVGETLDRGVNDLEKKLEDRLALFEAKAAALEQKAALYEQATKEMVGQMTALILNIKGIQFAPPIINVMVPEQPAPNVTVQAAEVPITVNVPEQPAPQITMPAPRPMRKNITYDDVGRPIEIVEREVSE